MLSDRRTSKRFTETGVKNLTLIDQKSSEESRNKRKRAEGEAFTPKLGNIEFPLDEKSVGIVDGVEDELMTLSEIEPKDAEESEKSFLGISEDMEGSTARTHQRSTSPHV